MTGTKTTLDDAERLAWLRLYRTENVGSVTFFRLLDRFGSACRALDALPDLARRGGRREKLRICSVGAAEQELQAIEKSGGRLMASIEAGFPPALSVLESVPLLTVLGDAALLSRDSVAIVGSRNASGGGRQLARMLALDLGQAGMVVVSGLARGIDTAAHEGALTSGTVAVMAGGVDVPYPPENTRLHAQIREQGCLVSEMPPATQPKAAHFPRRNRLVSGLSLGVVVVEAALRSGSLITARLALEQGRELFAVPGSPLDPRCHGTNNLIRQGAVLTESAADIVDILAPMRVFGRVSAFPQNAKTAQSLPQNDDFDPGDVLHLVLPLLSPAPVTVDEILRQCQLSPAALSTVLLELELAGRLERHPGKPDFTPAVSRRDP